MSKMTDEEWRSSLGMEEFAVYDAAKRCGLEWAPFMGDWFSSYSPRNCNNNAEGPWEHWVTLAQLILNDPLTKIVRPEVYQSVPVPPERHADADRWLELSELRARFEDETK